MECQGSTQPRDGIGGHCLPKDTKMFINSSNTIKSKILQAAMEIDEKSYKEYIRKLENEITTQSYNRIFSILFQTKMVFLLISVYSYKACFVNDSSKLYLEWFIMFW